jgi:8-oxo-dGTP diphosphatase
MTTIISAARACVVHDNKLLLVSSDGSFWHLPGGHMEPKESLSACAVREVYEETGYRITLGELLYVSEFYDKHWDSHKVEATFKASVAEAPAHTHWNDLGEDQSVTMQRWFSLEELQARNDILPRFLSEGKWLSGTGEIYRGYETNLTT